MAEIDKDKQDKIEDLLADYQRRIDFVAEKKVRALEELASRAKELKAKNLADKIKGNL